MRQRLIRRAFVAATCVALAIPLAGCESFDPASLTDWIPDGKKKLPGERKDVFPNGVPGVVQGVPPELVKGNQPPPEAAALAAPEQAPEAAAAPEEPEEKPKPKPKPKAKTAARPARPPATVAPTQQPSGSPWPAAPAQSSSAQQQPAPDSVWPAPPASVAR